jgi:hypothetical protein
MVQAYLIRGETGDGTRSTETPRVVDALFTVRATQGKWAGPRWPVPEAS